VQAGFDPLGAVDVVADPHGLPPGRLDGSPVGRAEVRAARCRHRELVALVFDQFDDVVVAAGRVVPDQQLGGATGGGLQPAGALDRGRLERLTVGLGQLLSQDSLILEKKCQ